tara:strand:+ start:383 stop:823 length:441 start_codon:yes stop_codon:yes gene_type:complete
MVSTIDMNKFYTDFIASLASDTSIFDHATKKQTEINEKYYDLFLKVAESSTAVSCKWASDTITKMQEAPKYDGDPSRYAKSLGDFVSAQADVTTENLAAYVEIAKKVQMDSVSLFLSSAKEVQKETVAAVKKAANDINPAKKKASN